jgi:hypothetical protein
MSTCWTGDYLTPWCVAPWLSPWGATHRGCHHQLGCVKLSCVVVLQGDATVILFFYRRLRLCSPICRFLDVQSSTLPRMWLPLHNLLGNNNTTSGQTIFIVIAYPGWRHRTHASSPCYVGSRLDFVPIVTTSGRHCQQCGWKTMLACEQPCLP